MRISYDLLLAMGQGSPKFHQFAAREGWTVPQAAALMVNSLSKRTAQAQRDELLSLFGEQCEFRIRSERDFSKTVDAMEEHLRPLDTREQRIREISEAARAHGEYFSPEKLKVLHSVASKASLTQGLNDKMRATDRHAEQRQPRHEPEPRFLASRDDARDLRSAVHASVAGARDDSPRLQITGATDATPLRDILRAATDGYEQLDAQNDPLMDSDLRDASNAV